MTHWERDTEALGPMRAFGPKYLEQFPLDQLFCRTGRWGWHCMDGGLFFSPGIHSMGTGHRLRPRQRQQIISDHALDHISWHEDCGYFGRHRRANGSGTGCQSEIDRHYHRWVCDEASHHQSRVVKARLRRPHRFHPEQIVYVDATGLFNPTQFYRTVGITQGLQLLPPGFIISQSALGDYGWYEVEQAISIACSDCGHGERFETKYPFVMVGIAHPDSSRPTSGRRVMEANLCRIAAQFHGLPLQYHVWVPPL